MILIDDYDVLTTAGQQPLAPFLPFLSSAPDIGLHFVVTRRVAGPPGRCTTRPCSPCGRAGPPGC